MLSVIVVITSGENHLGRCLGALSSQLKPPRMEIVVPVYASMDDVSALRRDWPCVRFVDVGDEPPAGAGMEHWQFDRRRAAGLAAARGDIVAMIEDHAIAGERWSRALWDAHARLPYGAIGGSIACRGTSLLTRAIFYCDFLRYQPPFAPGPAGYASDVNISYKRAAIERCRDTWRNFYHETAVHAKIRGAGDTVYLAPEIAVAYDRGKLPLACALHQRFTWGRVFAGRRAQEAGRAARLAYTVLSPGLMPLLLIRKLLLLVRRRQPVMPYLSALPLTALCLLFWSLGEFTGYATAQPFSRVRPGTGCKIRGCPANSPADCF